MPWVGLQCVVVVFPDHAHLLFDPDELVQSAATHLDLQCLPMSTFFDAGLGGGG